MLEKHLILWPIAALAALTFVVLNLMPFSRVVSVRSGKARVSDFKYGDTANVPEDDADHGMAVRRSPERRTPWCT